MWTFGPAETMASFILCEQVVEKNLAFAIEERGQVKACCAATENSLRCFHYMLQR